MKCPELTPGWMLTLGLLAIVACVVFTMGISAQYGDMWADILDLTPVQTTPTAGALHNAGVPEFGVVDVDLRQVQCVSNVS